MRFFICRTLRNKTGRIEIRLPIYNRSGFQIRRKVDWIPLTITIPNPDKKIIFAENKGG